MNAKQRFTPYNGPPSRLFPNTYKGNEQSGGYLARNSQPASSHSPAFKGRLWLQGVGWFWLSAWSVQGKNGTYLSLRGNPMSDEDAERYCAPKTQGNARTTQADPLDPFTPPSRPQSGYDDSDIPF